MNLIFASANQHKISEIQSLLPSSFLLLGLKDIELNHDIPEPGQTIKENSFLKANYVLNFLKENNKPKTAVFADDSGLEVIALNNAPGVHSSRYAGEPKNDENNNQKLLSELKSWLLEEEQILLFKGEQGDYPNIEDIENSIKIYVSENIIVN